MSKYISASILDKGMLRENNEDNAKIFDFDGAKVYIVCDGMGGHKKGEFASQMAIDTVYEYFYKHKKLKNNLMMQKSFCFRALKKANKMINSFADRHEDFDDMGTTAVLALQTEEETLISNIGDSRAYILKDDEFKQITEDQTYVNYLYSIGKITKDEMKNHPKRHVLMNALGTTPSIVADFFHIKNDYQALIIMSDGLYNMVEDNIIKEVLRSNDSPEEMCQRLVKIANYNGGKDNIAIIISKEVKN